MGGCGGDGCIVCIVSASKLKIRYLWWTDFSRVGRTNSHTILSNLAVCAVLRRVWGVVIRRGLAKML